MAEASKDKNVMEKVLHILHQEVGDFLKKELVEELLRNLGFTDAERSRITRSLPFKGPSISTQDFGAWVFSGPGEVAKSSYNALGAGDYCTIGFREPSAAASRFQLWGDAVAQAPPDLTTAEVFAFGRAHSVAWGPNLGLVAWGLDNVGQSKAPTVPEGEKVTSLVVGTRHSLALLSSGSVLAWGDNKNQQCDVPAGRTFQQIAAGGLTSAGITSDGTLLVWGEDFHGQPDMATFAPGESFKCVSVGKHHFLAVTASGSIKGWGDDSYGQVSQVPKLEPGEIWTKVSAGCFHNVGLSSKGRAFAWGANTDGQCRLPVSTNIRDIAAGAVHSAVLGGEGCVMCCGGNEFGQCSAV
eukprot:CAMPEP_0206431266 /NCGR_PEP_ID=MMETSP0324_2-20121206/7268_1 /ASSEMBLY_ACC=CAM_ASM_000836 /TAXON_ID=2866 /ORGANISM="Crypthecodinium cohnii, Strain Seligo" /LENGTH=353 /DNA_ID=CAMNT_0053897173 /DNA_START=44 /DNA_END=1105 /DNA_ORIENTATION=-